MPHFAPKSVTLQNDQFTVTRYQVYLRTLAIDGIQPGGTSTISAGDLSAADVDKSIRSVAWQFYILSAQTGTTDNLSSILGMQQGDVIVVLGATGHTITVKHSPGNIRLAGGRDFEITRFSSLMLWHTGTDIIEFGGRTTIP